MARPARPWFRFYVEAIHDQKLRSQPPAIRWLWVSVLGAARCSVVPGRLLVAAGRPMNADALADFAGMTKKDVERGMAEFAEIGMVSLDFDGAWSVTNWNTRQFESDSVDIPGRNQDGTRLPENRDRLNPPNPPLRRGDQVNPRANGTNPRAAGKAIEDEAKGLAKLSSAASFGRNLALGGLEVDDLIERCRAEFAAEPASYDAAVLGAREVLGGEGSDHPRRTAEVLARMREVWTLAGRKDATDRVREPPLSRAVGENVMREKNGTSVR